LLPSKRQTHPCLCFQPWTAWVWCFHGSDETKFLPNFVPLSPDQGHMWKINYVRQTFL
jgi:hypothetical protein